MIYLGIIIGVILGCFATIILLGISREIFKEHIFTKTSKENLKHHNNEKRHEETPPSSISHTV